MAQALYFSVSGNSTALASASHSVGPAEVTVLSTAPNQVYLVWQVGTGIWSSAEPPAPVPFLRPFVYTAEAPGAAVDVFSLLVEGSETQGALADVRLSLSCWGKACI